MPATLVVCRGEDVVGKCRGILENFDDRGARLRQEGSGIEILPGDCVYLDVRSEEGDGRHRFEAGGTVRWISGQDRPKAGIHFVFRSRAASRR